MAKKKVEREFIDTKAIEEKALNYLKTFIEDSERISQYLTDNDKGPCWDGHLYLYDVDGKNKKNLLGRVPVQVKGTEVKRFETKKWKFKLEKSDLQAYLHEPTFFIVCQIKKNSKERKLFYRELLLLENTGNAVVSKDGNKQISKYNVPDGYFLKLMPSGKLVKPEAIVYVNEIAKL